jgi:phage terminase small subunit
MPTVHNPPERLCDAAQEVWREVYNEMAQRNGGVFTSALLDMLERYAFMSAECRRMQDELFNQPTIIEKGKIVSNPLVKVLYQYNTMLCQLAKSIGLVAYQPTKKPAGTKASKDLLDFAKG